MADPTPTPAPAVHESFLQHLEAFAKHLASEVPKVLPYLGEIAKVAAVSGVHMSPQASIIVGAVSAVAAATQPTPTPTTDQP